MGERVAAVPGQLVGAEPTHSAQLGDGRKPGCEAKTVGQPTEIVRPLGEAAAAVGLPLLKLPQQRGDPHQDAIGFHPGAIDRLKTTLCRGRLQASKKRRTVLLHPGVERRGGVGEVELWETLHQRQGRIEGANRRLPGVRHRPEPGQIQMGVAQEMETARGASLGHPRQQVGKGSLLELWLQRCQGIPRETRGAQRQSLGRQHPSGVREIRWLLLEPAVNQGPVVMQRGAQPQLQLQRLAFPPRGRQGPAAGAVEQVALVHQGPIGPELHGIGPPTEGQTGTPITALSHLPGLRADQLQAQADPAPAARPAQQSTLMPVGAVACTPGVIQGQNAVSVRRLHAPERQQVPTGLCLKRFNPGANSALWPL